MENENILCKRAYDFSKKADTIQTVIIALLALLVPTFLSKLLSLIFGVQSSIATNSQIIVGSIVNTVLIISAINLKGWQKILFIITMPSIATILSGYIFGPFSIPMIYMIPAIWVGNFALVYAYKLFMIVKGKNYFFSGIIGVIIKVAIIFGYFSILNFLGIVPEKAVSALQKSMSIIQLITATIGMILAYIVFILEKNKVK